jgi:penicillin amidase
MARKPAELPRLVWGKRNVSQIKHPFSSLLPRAISRLINFPERELSGDGLVVRVNKPKNGASMRMVIDLSDFKNSRFSQPGGQSGYFLSPYYQDLFESWYLGRGVSFEAVEVESRQEIVP